MQEDDGHLSANVSSPNHGSEQNSPIRPTLAHSIVFGRSGVEESDTWATFERPAFRVAHSFVLKPHMSKQEVDAVKAVCKMIPQTNPAAVAVSKADRAFDKEVSEAGLRIAKLNMNDTENTAPPPPLGVGGGGCKPTGGIAQKAYADGRKAPLAFLSLQCQR